MPFNYIDNNLLHDEKIIYVTRPHWIVFMTAVFIALLSWLLVVYLPFALSTIGNTIVLGMPLYKLISLIVFLLAIVQGIRSFIMYQTSEYGVTDKRILMKTGWIRRRSIEIFLEKVEAIYVNQSIPGRIFGYGTIVIVGTGGSKDPFLFVPSPLKFRHRAQEQIDLDESARRRS